MEMSSTSTSQTVHPGSVTRLLQKEHGRTPDTVYEYAKAYADGPVAFEKKFSQEYVELIQSGHRKKKHFLSKSPKYADAFAYLKGMQIKEIQSVGMLQVSDQLTYLKERAIHPKDFESWINELHQAAEHPELTFTENDLFGEVMKAFFILNELE